MIQPEQYAGHKHVAPSPDLGSVSTKDGFTVSGATRDLHDVLDNIGGALGDLQGAIAPVLMPYMKIEGDNHQAVAHSVSAPVVDELIRAIDRLKAMYEGLHALRDRVRV